MGSLGFGEIAFIAIVALLVFGPDRLPEIARKAGELMTKAREATRAFTDAIDSEYDDVAAPLRDLKADFDATKNELKSAASTVLDVSADAAKLTPTPKAKEPDEKPTADQPDGEDAPKTDEASE